MFYKKIYSTIFLIIFLTSFANAKIYPIDAEKNAQSRNNSGVLYMKDRDYFAAIKEFKIAIAINPNHQTSAIYYNNLGRAYLEIAKIQKTHNLLKKNDNFAHFAQMSFENAIDQDCMQLNFYKNLVESFALQERLSSELKKYQKDTKNPFNEIVVALIYEKSGKQKNAQIALDNFISQYPDLLITISLKDYIRKNVNP